MPELPGAAGRLSADGTRTPLDDLLAQARRLLQGGQPLAAWELLDPRAERYAGTPRFDFLLGISALDANLPGHAILALERVLAVEPGHLQARAEIARAYLAANEPITARREFETVARQPIPAEVAARIDRYLAAIDRGQTEKDGSSSFFAEIGVGYDSNVNFGSSSNAWLLADGTAVTPLAVSRAQSSPVLNLQVGGYKQKPLGGGWEVTYGGSLSHRDTPSAHSLDQTIADLSAGIQRRAGCHQTTMQAQLQHLRLDSAAFRNATGLVGQWRCDVDANNQVGLFAQGFEFTFPGQSVRDARRLSLGATYAHLFQGAMQPIVLANLYGGNEQTHDRVGQLDYRFAGVRTSVSVKLGQGWQAYGTLSWERRDFAAAEPLFGVVREDRQTDLRIGADKDLNRHWTVSPQLTATRNASTLAPNDFRRVQAMIFSRYRF